MYEHRHTGDVFLIPDPELKLAELEKVQEEVVLMLGGKPRDSACPAPRGDVSGQTSEVSEDEDDDFDDDEEDEDDE